MGCFVSATQWHLSRKVQHKVNIIISSLLEGAFSRCTQFIQLSTGNNMFSLWAIHYQQSLSKTLVIDVYRKLRMQSLSRECELTLQCHSHEKSNVGHSKY